MSKHIELTPTKTYATAENAHKAVAKKFGDNLPMEHAFGPLRYIVMTHTDGRFFPVFIGVNAMHYGVHFHFNILA
jgi:hypothetical protein